MKYDIRLVIKDLLDVKMGEVDIAKSELRNLQDACDCDIAYEVYDMFEGACL
jgi:hypothetical protein